MKFIWKITIIFSFLKERRKDFRIWTHQIKGRIRIHLDGTGL